MQFWKWGEFDLDISPFIIPKLNAFVGKPGYVCPLPLNGVPNVCCLPNNGLLNSCCPPNDGAMYGCRPRNWLLNDCGTPYCWPVERVIVLFPGYLPSPYWSPYWICTQHSTCQWSWLLRAIPAILETNALREVLWQRVGKFLLKSSIALEYIHQSKVSLGWMVFPQCKCFKTTTPYNINGVLNIG